MKTETAVHEMIESLKQQQDEGFQINQEEVVKEYERRYANQSSLTIKILSIAGGLLAGIAFIGFLFMFGIADSGVALIVLGAILVGISLLICNTVDQLIIDTAAIAGFVIGLFLIAAGMVINDVNEDTICFWLMIASATSFLFSKNAILIFISLLAFSGSILELIMSNRPHEMIHLFIAANVVSLAYWTLNEGKIITKGKRFCEVYDPVRIGLIFSLVVSLGITMTTNIFMRPIGFVWISSLAIIPVLLYLVKRILDIIQVTELKEKAVAYVISLLVLLATFFAPAISGALVIMLLCFLVNYKTGFVVGVLAFIYFTCQYYYDLNVTLLTKSILMLASGVLFVLFYLLTNKKLENNEKI